MKTLLYILIFILTSFSLLGQDKIDKESSDVFSFLIRDKQNIFLLPNLDTATFRSIQYSLSKNQYIRRITINDSLHVDTLSFTKDEISYIENFFEVIKNFTWTQKDINRYGLSKFNLIDNNKRNRQSGFDYTIYQIMKPIFLRNNSICLVYYEYFCGSLCGHGELSILIKINGKWGYWKNIFSIDS